MPTCPHVHVCKERGVVRAGACFALIVSVQCGVGRVNVCAHARAMCVGAVHVQLKASLQIGSSEIDDQFAGFFGNVNNQIATVQQQVRFVFGGNRSCLQLANDPKLAKGFNAIGFSQGGQFLRGYVEKFNNPPVYNLITFGGQVTLEESVFLT